MRATKLLVTVAVTFFAVACTKLMLKPADFSWPIENVLKIDSKGDVEEQRHTFKLNVKQLLFAEFKDSTNFAGKEIRIIRDKAGYYFITGKNFKNVYVFLPVEGGMKLENTILISETNPLVSPAFNQKAPNIELLDGTKKYLLNYKGIVR